MICDLIIRLGGTAAQPTLKITKEIPEMRPDRFRAARLRLIVAGRTITQAELAAVMGYSGQPAISAIENGVSDVPAQSARLMLAYTAGYRPMDWPTGIGRAEK